LLGSRHFQHYQQLHHAFRTQALTGWDFATALQAGKYSSPALLQMLKCQLYFWHNGCQPENPETSIVKLTRLLSITPIVGLTPAQGQARPPGSGPDNRIRGH
jgi:hypothetical protein